MMTAVIRDSAGNIKTFMQTSAGYVPEPGETLEEVDVPFTDYAVQLRISIDGRSGETVRVPVGSQAVNVRVECPGETAVTLLVSGETQVVALENGDGSLTLPCDVPGRFVIAPADRVTFCAGGEAVSVVEVVQNS
jgi:hypothetical protein